MVDKIFSGDIITVMLCDNSFPTPNPLLNVPIVYEDSDIIVFNKPYNMPVHQSIRHYDDTLANFFAYHTQSNGEYINFRPINRLDRDTTGLCLVAKNSLAAKKLAGNVEKIYTAVLCGKIKVQSGKIDAPIGRVSDSIIKRCVCENGQPSISEFNLIAQNEKYSLVRVTLLTGRTHQIRVHFSYIGYPLAGDDMYGGNTDDIKRQALCCNEIKFLHPASDKPVELKIDIDDDMKALII